VSLNSDEPTTLIESMNASCAIIQRQTLELQTRRRRRSVSAEEMLRRARNLAAGLHSLGMRKGDRVAILSERLSEWVLAVRAAFFPAW